MKNKLRTETDFMLTSTEVFVLKLTVRETKPQQNYFFRYGLD